MTLANLSFPSPETLHEVDPSNQQPYQPPVGSLEHADLLEQLAELTLGNDIEFDSDNSYGGYSESEVRLARAISTRSEVAPEWQAFADCRGQQNSTFFPEVGGNGKKARTICQQCLVKEECLEYALANPKLEGMWAGTTKPERDAIRKRLFFSNEQS